MMRFAARVGLAIAALCGPIAAAHADPAHPPPMEAEAGTAPVTISAVYTADLWQSRGGIAKGSRYLDNLDIIVDGDLDRAAGIEGARAHVYLLYNNGASLSELTGDAFVASNIETGVRAVRLYEAWVEHDLARGVNLRAGLYDLNSEFDSLDAAGLFIGSAHGIGPDISQSGANGPSIFPVTSLAARLSVAPSPALTVRAAVFDAVPGSPAHPRRTAVVLGEGALGIVEADWRRGGLRLLAGAWGYSKRQPRIDGTGGAASNGVYLRGEGCLPLAPDCKMQAFARIGAAAGRANTFARFASFGAKWQLTDRTVAGLAVAHGFASAAQRAAERGFGDETSLELTLAHRFSPQFSLQPDIQWIRRAPAGGQRHARVMGLRLTFEPFARD
jgi:porin